VKKKPIVPFSDGRLRVAPKAKSIDFPQTLRFGRHFVSLRWLGPADVGRLLEFFDSHTPETIRDRYGFLFAHLSPERAAELVGIDQSKDAALGVFEERKRNTLLIAIGRYCRSVDGRTAEVAFVVREDRRGLGIATRLLGALVGIARSRGLLRLTAQVHADNHAMLGVLRKAGAIQREHTPGGEIEMSLALQPTASGDTH